MSKKGIGEGIDIHDGVRVVNPTPVDWWSGPYESVEEANTSIPLAIRYPTMIVRVVNGNDVFLYWYKNGIKNGDLVQYLPTKVSELDNDSGFITQEDLDLLGGDMLKFVYDSDDSGIVDNAKKVNGLTVETAVPKNAIFTDTTYTAGDNISIGEDNKISVTGQLGLTEEEVKKVKVDKAVDADTVGGFTVEKNIPVDAKFTDTIQDISNLATKDELPTKTSQLKNDSGFVDAAGLSALGYGDMLKSVYDTDGDGIVDNANKVNNLTVETAVPKNAKFTDTIVTKSDMDLDNVENKSSATIRGEITNSNVTKALKFTPEDSAKKGTAGGYAQLDGNAKIPLSELPDIAKQQTYVVASITERDDLSNLIMGEKCYITGTGDSYIWDSAKWVILAKADWENVNLQWSNIVGKPKSSIDNIDDSVEKRHEHPNKSTLDGITEDVISKWNDAWAHTKDEAKHVTSEERTKWDTVDSKASKAYVDVELDKKVDSEEGKSLISISEIERLKNVTNQDISNLATKDKIPTKISQLENDSDFLTDKDLEGLGGGDMFKSVYDTDGDGIVDNAKKVNNLTVETAVPKNAVFTDTITTINGKTGEIFKEDIVALGISASGGSDKTLKDLDDVLVALVATVPPPTYVYPTLSINLQNAILEIGSPNNRTIKNTFIQNDGGALTSQKLLRNGISVNTSDSYMESGVVPPGVTRYKAEATYEKGVIKENSIKVPDDRGIIEAGTVSSVERTITGILPYFWKEFDVLPDLDSLTLNGFNKIIKTSDGSVLIPMNIKNKYLVIALPSTTAKKRKWEITTLNAGNVGTGNLFIDPQVEELSSPQNFWNNQSYDIYVTGYASDFEPKIELKNS